MKCLVCGEDANGVTVKCVHCDTVHHEDCWDYAGGCSVYGCNGTRHSGHATAAASKTVYRRETTGGHSKEVLVIKDELATVPFRHAGALAWALWWAVGLGLFSVCVALGNFDSGLYKIFGGWISFVVMISMFIWAMFKPPQDSDYWEESPFP